MSFQLERHVTSFRGQSPRLYWLVATRLKPCPTHNPFYETSSSLPAASVDFAVHSCPKLFAHCFAIKLPGRSLGDFGHKFDRLRRLHSSKLHLTVSDDLTLRKGFAVVPDDERFDRLSPLVVGHADDGALLNLHRGHNAGLALGAVDIKATADNHVLLAIHDIHVAMLVDVSDIAGVMPAVAANFSSGLRQVVVAGSDQRAAGYDFSGLMRREDATGIVHDRKTNRCRRPPTTAQAFRTVAGGGRDYGARIEEGEQHGRFHLAIGFAHAGAEDFHPLLEFVRRDGRTRQQKNAQTRIVELTYIWMGEQRIERRRRKKEVSHAILLNRLQHLRCVESGQDYISSAESEHREGDNAGGMRERRRAEADRIFGIASPIVNGHLGHCAPSKVGNTDAARRAGGSARGNEAHHLIEISVKIVAMGISPAGSAVCVFRSHEVCE